MGQGSYNYWIIYILAFFSLNLSILTKFVSSMQNSCSNHERIALLNFKHSFQIDCDFSSRSPFAYPKVTSWTFSDKEDCCSWDGVECDEKTGLVIGLDLSSSCLHGSFLPNNSLFSLSHLTNLNLADNHFNLSQIPTQIGRLNRLKSLDLSNSAFSGQIPSDISKLSQLSLLNFSNSYKPVYYGAIELKLYGTNIDKLVQNLTNLRVLDLDTVDISSAFPAILSNFTSLKVLSLQLCNLYGELPPNLFQLPHLEVLMLSGNNNLAGFLPEIQWHSHLKILFLSYTSLSGELPSSIGKLAHMETLSLQSCQFSGLLPSSLGNLTTLTFLLLEDNYFRGDISFSLANLTNLKGLGLSNLNVKPGQLFSQLPKPHKLTQLGLNEMKLDFRILSLLANFTRLQYLDLASTNLKGPFPGWLANLTQLYQLTLNNNELMGPIPQWISYLNNLLLLDLSGTNLFGKFETFSNCKNLRALDLSGTNISLPSISGANASLIQLEFLGLSRGKLTEFPQFLQHQNQLQVLFLQENNIGGCIPQWFVTVTKDNLLSIDLAHNNLIGFEDRTVVLPWNKLEYIDISGNKFHGQLPSPTIFIKEYSAYSNLFSGNIPDHICNATSLASLDLSMNMLRGQIPHCVAYLLGESLQILDLRRNNLRGIIPRTFTRSCKLKMINLSNNDLGGRIPKSLINCSMLEELDIGRNRVNDTFPSWLGSLQKLQVLVLNHNNFHGIIMDPKSSNDFHLLRIIDLSNNFHSGDLPSSYLQNWHEMDGINENRSYISNIRINTFLQMGQYFRLCRRKFDYSITITNKGSERLYPKILKVFSIVDFSSNNFTGRIPDFIGNLRGLQALNLSNNNLYGRIPPSLANISDLESLDLSQNMLSGKIPSLLSQLTFLGVFNVSYNQLEGPIPTGNQFNTFDNSSFRGNLRLCGTPLSKECNTTDAPHPPENSMTKDYGNEDTEFINWIFKSFGFVSGCTVGYVIGNLFITDKYHDWFMKTFGIHRSHRRVQRPQRHRR